MTLNITVATPRCIFQSADYRLQDVTTKKTFDFQTQKLVLINNSRWSATVCFAGVGRTDTVDVSEWLAERVAAIEFADPFERLLDELKTADAWLSKVPSPYNRHSFSIGAFVGTHPVFALVSNFEKPNGPPSPTATSDLSVFELRPTKPITFISGQKQAVTRAERRWLTALVAKDPDANQIYAALAEINQTAAKRTHLISPACFTGHVRLTGEGGGQVHDMGNRPFMPKFSFPPSFQGATRELLDKQFGPGRGRLVQMVFARSEPTEEYHQTQLREKPNDPNTHSNYGAFLKEIKKDTDGAEREFLNALELDANHVNALGNLANLLWERGEQVEAVIQYKKALGIDPGNENVTLNYARHLSRDANNHPRALQLLKKGINNHPDSSRLIMLHADLSLTEGAVLDALEGYRSAREKDADQAKVEAGYTFALQMSGAPVGDCIAAYYTAIALNPENADLKLNLAQLLFVKDDNVKANLELQQALTLGINEPAQLEAQFYLLSHTSSDPAEIFKTMKQLISKGARLRWDVHQNIETVRGNNPEKAERLTLVAKVMKGEMDQELLDQLLSQWT